MNRLLLAVAALLLSPGCERSAVDPNGPDTTHPVVQVLIVDGFGELEPQVSLTSMVRLPGYYDLSSFDSIRVSFTAERTASGTRVDHILVKVGPACYKQDSLAAPRKDFSVVFMRWELTKSWMNAVSFLTPDQDATLLLSRLKVVGWTVQ